MSWGLLPKASPQKCHIHCYATELHQRPKLLGSPVLCLQRLWEKCKYCVLLTRYCNAYLHVYLAHPIPRPPWTLSRVWLPPFPVPLCLSSLCSSHPGLPVHWTGKAHLASGYLHLLLLLLRTFFVWLSPSIIQFSSKNATFLEKNFLTGILKWHTSPQFLCFCLFVCLTPVLLPS